MPRGTTLEVALLMLKGELGQIVSTVGSDNELYQYIDNVELWLASEWDWPFLADIEDIEMVAGTVSSSRYYNAPALSFERPVQVTVLYGTHWYCVDFGISEEEYNQLSSGDGSIAPVQASPVRRWKWRYGNDTQIEVWPLPSEVQTLRFKGQKVIPSLRDGSGEFDPDSLLVLDDLLIVKFAAAQKLQRMEKKDAAIVLAQAEARLNRLRAVHPKDFDEPLILGGSADKKKRKYIFMAAGTSSSTGLVLLGTVLPEGNQEAVSGVLYFKTSEPRSLWLKQTGTGTTGWVEIVGT